MEELGHQFFVFVNAETERVAILYRRDDGDYGLIEPVVGGEYTKGRSHALERAGARRRRPALVACRRPDDHRPREARRRPRRTMPRMLPDGRRLGAHLPLGRGMVKAVDRAHEIGAGALQIFADNPTAWRRRAEPPAEQAAFRARLTELDIGPIAIHASYLVNLAGPEDDLFGRSVGLLASELRAAPGLSSARFVNVHVGSHRGAGVAGRDRPTRGRPRARRWPRSMRHRRRPR